MNKLLNKRPSVSTNIIQVWVTDIGQTNYPTASEVTLKHVDKINHDKKNTAKSNKT